MMCNLLHRVAATGYPRFPVGPIIPVELGTIPEPRPAGGIWAWFRAIIRLGPVFGGHGNTLPVVG
jgi:hypothetical protein